MNLLLL
jgi:hypothetical protein